MFVNESWLYRDPPTALFRGTDRNFGRFRERCALSLAQFVAKICGRSFHFGSPQNTKLGRTGYVGAGASGGAAASLAHPAANHLR